MIQINAAEQGLSSIEVDVSLVESLALVVVHSSNSGFQVGNDL